MEFLTNINLNVLGVQRTGQHAIASWLIGHFNNVCFRNGVSKKLDSCLIPPFWYFDLDKNGFKRKISQDALIAPNQDAIIIGSEYTTRPFKMPDNIEQEKLEMAQKQGKDEFAKTTFNVIVIRSPWNHLASVLSWKSRWYLKKKERFIKCWKMVAKEYAGKTDNIPCPKVFVKYDEWFANKSYRQDISKKLGIPFSDRGVNNVMP